jgi:alkaline phosphatase isozyme conversion protein
MSALPSRGGLLAIAVAAALVLAIGLAAAGAFAGCDKPLEKTGRPSAAVSLSAHGAVAYATAKTLAKSVPPRVTDSWGDIRAREFITGAFQQYGYFPLTQEFISGTGATRVHSANIIAVKEGASAKRLIVGAHYDSTPMGQGYVDNATGIGLLLEAAARVKPRVTPYTIVFVAFGAEERGLSGSRYYARTMSSLESHATIGMIDLDAVAGGATLLVTSRRGGPTWLRDDALAAAQDLGVPLGTTAAAAGRPAGVSLAPSDDLPFALGDVATAAFTSSDPDPGAGAEGRGLWHTPADTVAHVEKTYPGRVARQLADLSRLLETLLTSKLEKHK